MVNRTAANLMNQFLFGQSSTSQIPAYWYVGVLKTKLPTSNLNGTVSGYELTNGGYYRIRLPNTADYFEVVGSSAELSYVTNKNDIVFPDITSGGNTPVAGFFLSNVQTGGNAYIWGHLSTARTVYINSRIVIKAGALHFAISNTEGSGTSTQGLIVDDNGVLSGSMDVSTAGILS